MKTDTAELSYSVIIEWENVLLAESTRALEMLRRLASQVRSVREQGIEGEVVLVRNADDASAASLDEMVDTTFGTAAGTVRQIAVLETRYYDKKNTGAAASRGKVIVFLDSDVIPEDGWLDRLLASFSQPGVDVVAGATYLDATTLYAKAVAAFWFFPPRSADEGLVPADALFGNNIAFRREIFLSNPFPPVSQYRGQMGLVVRALRERGCGIYEQRGARCAHPPPNGLAHFFRRALCEGYDNIVASRRANGASRLPWRHTYWSTRSWLRSSFGAIRERRKILKLTFIEVLAASSVALCYIAFMALGEILTRLDSTIVPKRFSI